MMMKTGKRRPVYNTFVSNMYMFNESKQSGQTVWQPDQTTAGFSLIYTAVLQSFLFTQTLVSSKTKNLPQLCLLCNNKQLVGQGCWSRQEWTTSVLPRNVPISQELNGANPNHDQNVNLNLRWNLLKRLSAHFKGDPNSTISSSLIGNSRCQTDQCLISLDL